MGKRGPKPKPTALKILNGNPGRKPLPKDEPRPQLGLPSCPTWLTGEAKRLWGRLARRLDACGVTTKVDGPAFEQLVTLCTQYQEACREVARTGVVWIEEGEDADPARKFVRSPYWVVQLKTGAQLLALLREFGMTPSARSTVKTVVPLVDKEDSASQYFG